MSVAYRTVTVGPFQQPPSQSSTIPTPTVFISRLRADITASELEALGAFHGNVDNVRLITKEGDCKSFAFICFDNTTSAGSCVEGLRTMGYHATYARETFKDKLSRLSDPGETNIYIKAIPASYTQGSLERLFAPVPIVSSRILDSSRNSDSARCVALVRVRTREDAQLMIDKLHGLQLPESDNPLVVRFADSFAQKVARAEAQGKPLPSSGGAIPVDGWIDPMSLPIATNPQYTTAYSTPHLLGQQFSPGAHSPASSLSSSVYNSPLVNQSMAFPFFNQHHQSQHQYAAQGGSPVYTAQDYALAAAILAQGPPPAASTGAAAATLVPGAGRGHARRASDGVGLSSRGGGFQGVALGGMREQDRRASVAGLGISHGAGAGSGSGRW